MAFKIVCPCSLVKILLKNQTRQHNNKLVYAFLFSSIFEPNKQPKCLEEQVTGVCYFRQKAKGK